MPQTFKKSERLTNKKTLEALFDKGQVVNAPPFRLIWIKEGKITVPIQAVISVPKRSFPRAVDRNTLKRRIREAYRKNKENLYEVLKNKNLSIALMIIYNYKQELPYKDIEEKMMVSLQRLATKIPS